MNYIDTVVVHLKQDGSASVRVAPSAIPALVEAMERLALAEMKLARAMELLRQNGIVGDAWDASAKKAGT